MSQPLAMAEGTTYSSLRILFPPRPRPEEQSSRLAQIWALVEVVELTCRVRLGSGWRGEGWSKRRGVRSNEAKGSGKTTMLIAGPVVAVGVLVSYRRVDIKFSDKGCEAR